jgi:hypothetical protein
MAGRLRRKMDVFSDLEEVWTDFQKNQFSKLCQIIFQILNSLNLPIFYNFWGKNSKVRIASIFKVMK